MFETEYLLMLITLQPALTQGLFPLAPKCTKINALLFQTPLWKSKEICTALMIHKWKKILFSHACESWMLCFWHKLVEGHSWDLHVLTVFNTSQKENHDWGSTNQNTNKSVLGEGTGIYRQTYFGYSYKGNSEENNNLIRKTAGEIGNSYDKKI